MSRSSLSCLYSVSCSELSNSKKEENKFDISKGFVDIYDQTKQRLRQEKINHNNNNNNNININFYNDYNREDMILYPDKRNDLIVERVLEVDSLHGMWFMESKFMFLYFEKVNLFI